MTDTTTDTTATAEPLGPPQTIGPPAPRVPWWNIESPLRRRIKGRYVRRAAIAVAACNVVLLTAMGDAEPGAGAAPPEGLRQGLALPATHAPPLPLARMAALAP